MSGCVSKLRGVNGLLKDRRHSALVFSVLLEPFLSPFRRPHTLTITTSLPWLRLGARRGLQNGGESSWIPPLPSRPVEGAGSPTFIAPAFYIFIHGS